jgi:hypothetical protein
VWLSGAAARAAARAAAIGRDPTAAARAVLPGALARGVAVDSGDDGSVTVRVPIPAVVVDVRLASIRARARLASQVPS